MPYRIFIFALLLGFLFPAENWAQTAPAPARMKVGVSDRPPFALKDKHGRWTGLAVDLWVKIAAELNISYDYVETPLDDMVPDLAQGKLDLALGEIGVSAEREKLVDFTQPYITSSAAVVVPHTAQTVKWEEFLAELGRHGVWAVFLIMLGTLVIFSFLIWLLERSLQKGHFSGNAVRGFGSALWFAAVTMTTVGYGDKTPQTAGGRIVAFFWMFFGIIIVSVFTGAVASSLTVSRLNQGVVHMSDLSRFRDGVVDGSISQEILTALGISAREYATNEEGFAALKKGEIKAFVGTEPTLAYISKHDYPGEFDLMSLPTTRTSYAMAARPGLPHFRDINIALIDRTTSPQWQHELDRWLGPSEK